MKQAVVLLLILSVVVAQLSDADIQAALSFHNNARAAKGVAPLTWDPKLATVAQNYANTCVFEHNPNRGTQYVAQGGTGGVGENLAAASPTQSVSGGITGWNNEESDWNCASNTCSDVCGHYTQVVWAASTKLGCGKATCTRNSPFGNFNSGRWEILVCNYNPPGNFNGQRPFAVAQCSGAAIASSRAAASSAASSAPVVRTSAASSAPVVRTSAASSAPVVRTSAASSAPVASSNNVQRSSNVASSNNVQRSSNAASSNNGQRSSNAASSNNGQRTSSGNGATSRGGTNRGTRGPRSDNGTEIDNGDTTIKSEVSIPKVDTSANGVDAGSDEVVSFAQTLVVLPLLYLLA